MSRKYVRTKIFSPTTRFMDWSTDATKLATYDKMFLTGDDWTPVTSFTVNVTNQLATIVCPNHRLNRLEVIEIRNAIEAEANSQYRVESIIDGDTFTIAYNESNHTEITGTNLELHLAPAGWLGTSGDYVNSKNMNIKVAKIANDSFDVFYNNTLLPQTSATGANNAVNRLDLSVNKFYIDDIGVYANRIIVGIDGINRVGYMSAINYDYGNYCILSYTDATAIRITESVNYQGSVTNGSGAMNFGTVQRVFRNVGNHQVGLTAIQGTNETYLQHPTLAEGTAASLRVFAYETNILIAILGVATDPEIFFEDNHYVRATTVNQSTTATAYIKISDWQHNEGVL